MFLSIFRSRAVRGRGRGRGARGIYTYLFYEWMRSNSGSVHLRHTWYHLQNNETGKCRREGEPARVSFISLLDSSILRISPRIHLVSRSLLPHPLADSLDTSRYSFRIPKPPRGSISLTSRQSLPSCNIFCVSFDAHPIKGRDLIPPASREKKSITRIEKITQNHDNSNEQSNLNMNRK